MFNFEFLLEIADNEEIQEELFQRLVNLKTLLTVKKRLGDLVDITDRLFGYFSYCDEGNNPFIFSTISVIFDLPEKLENRIFEGSWMLEEWLEEGYPPTKNEEISSLHIPFSPEYSQEEMAQAIEVIKHEGLSFLVKEDHFIAYCDSDYIYEMYYDIIDICIELRLFLEGGEVNA